MEQPDPLPSVQHCIPQNNRQHYRDPFLIIFSLLRLPKLAHSITVSTGAYSAIKSVDFFGWGEKNQLGGLPYSIFLLHPPCIYSKKNWEFPHPLNTLLRVKYRSKQTLEKSSKKPLFLSWYFYYMVTEQLVI